MKRYQMGYPNNGMDEHPEGRWVAYSEAGAEIRGLRDRVDELQRQLTEATKRHEPVKITLYHQGMPVGTAEIPAEVVNAAKMLDAWLHDHVDGTQICGLGRVDNLQRQLAEVTAERDAARTILQNIRAELENAK